MWDRSSLKFSVSGVLVLSLVLGIIGMLTYRSSLNGNGLFSNQQHFNLHAVTDTNEISAALERRFDHLHAANIFNGAVLVARHDTILFSKYYGWANGVTKQALSDSSMFQLASATKPFTATAILLLLDDKKIVLEDPVSKYLPGFPYEKITVKNLLQHASGLQDYTKINADAFPFADSLLSNENILVWLIKNKPALWFHPGSRFNYCNTNYALLALIVERVSGLTFGAYLHKNIFLPIGMSSAKLLPGKNIPGITDGHTHSGMLIATDYYDQVYGDKGLYASTHDLFLFSRALFEHLLLEKETFRMAVGDSIYARRHNKYYGLGWRITFDDKGRKVTYHNGWWHGYRSAFHRRLNDEVTIVILSNKLNNTVYRATQNIFDILDGMDPNARTEGAEEE